MDQFTHSCFVRYYKKSKIIKTLLKLLPNVFGTSQHYPKLTKWQFLIFGQCLVQNINNFELLLVMTRPSLYKYTTIGRSQYGQKLRETQKFSKHYPDSPQIHFGPLSISQSVPNDNFVFFGQSLVWNISHFLPFLVLICPSLHTNTTTGCPRHVQKLKKKSKIVKTLSKLPPNSFWATQHFPGLTKW